MPSEVDLLNDALGQIGATRIGAIDDGSTNANYCQTFYPSLRDYALTLTYWVFNGKRIELAQNPAPPLFEFAVSFKLPTDLLAIREFNGANVITNNLWWGGFGGTFLGPTYDRYKIEGPDLLTNDTTALIVYSYRNTNPNLWSPGFYQLVAALLASKLASAIAKDEKKSQGLLSKAMTVLLPLEAGINGQQGSVSPFQSSDLIWGR